MPEHHPDVFALFFAPQDWTAARRFSQFVGPPFSDREVAKGVQVALNPLNKFEVLAGLANRLAPGIKEDNVELDRYGHTPAIRAREFAALIEALVAELYSSLDGVRRAIFGAYRAVEKMQNESTEKLFKRAGEQRYGNGFPEELRQPLAPAWAGWFPALRQLRTELAHGDVGSCHLDRTSGRVRYMHQALDTSERAMVVDDIVGELNAMFLNVGGVIEAVFSFLYSQRQPVERRVMCGIYKGRIYERLVAPEPQLSGDSGRCFSKSWFSAERGTECSLLTRCGAYRREGHES